MHVFSIYYAVILLLKASSVGAGTFIIASIGISDVSHPPTHANDGLILDH